MHSMLTLSRCPHGREGPLLVAVGGRDAEKAGSDSRKRLRRTRRIFQARGAWKQAGNQSRLGSLTI